MHFLLAFSHATRDEINKTRIKAKIHLFFFRENNCKKINFANLDIVSVQTTSVSFLL